MWARRPHRRHTTPGRNGLGLGVWASAGGGVDAASAVETDSQAASDRPEPVVVLGTGAEATMPSACSDKVLWRVPRGIRALQTLASPSSCAPLRAASGMRSGPRTTSADDENHDQMHRRQAGRHGPTIRRPRDDPPSSATGDTGSPRARPQPPAALAGAPHSRTGARIASAEWPSKPIGSVTGRFGARGLGGRFPTSSPTGAGGSEPHKASSCSCRCAWSSPAAPTSTCVTSSAGSSTSTSRR